MTEPTTKYLTARITNLDREIQRLQQEHAAAQSEKESHEAVLELIKQNEETLPRG